MLGGWAHLAVGVVARQQRRRLLEAGGGQGSAFGARAAVAPGRRDERPQDGRAVEAVSRGSSSRSIRSGSSSSSHVRRSHGGRGGSERERRVGTGSSASKAERWRAYYQRNGRAGGQVSMGRLCPAERVDKQCGRSSQQRRANVGLLDTRPGAHAWPLNCYRRLDSCLGAR